MSLKARAALQYMLPVALAYAALVTALAAGEALGWPTFTQKTAPAALLCLICQAVQDVVPTRWKEVLVYWRLHDRLPGHRAFTEHAVGDARIPDAALARLIAGADMAPREQNALWYRHYLAGRAEPQVAHENFRYLAWRDTTMLLLLLAFGSAVFGATAILSWRQTLYVGGSCALAALFGALAARNTGQALVRNVVARAAAKPVKASGATRPARTKHVSAKPSGKE